MYNRHYYCKKITQAVNRSNKGKKMYGSEVHFKDDVDWGCLDGKGTWTDVFLESGGSSVFAFTFSSSYHVQGCVPGSVPEAIRDLESGLWNLYIHKNHITEEDIGLACKRWIEHCRLQK